MKPTSTNRQLPGLSGIRREPRASPELRLGWMQATTFPVLSERKGKKFFLTSSLIGLIELQTSSTLLRFAPGYTEVSRRNVRIADDTKTIALKVISRSFTFLDDVRSDHLNFYEGK